MDGVSQLQDERSARALRRYFIATFRAEGRRPRGIQVETLEGGDPITAMTRPEVRGFTVFGTAGTATTASDKI